MGGFRDAVAGNVTEVFMFLGIALLFLGGEIGVGAVAALGVVTFLAAIFLSDPIEALLRSGGSDDDATTDPVDELRQRYARGEIDEAEFEQRLDRLLETENVESVGEQDRERVRDVE
ncbi:SHOCT domain-containing protein [Halosimplex halobium]|uniref:SHOCT domain-containing protein n=1 Tax=Halosimplex halobium TaxID=3396618 RepID=UPI003F55594D